MAIDLTGYTFLLAPNCASRSSEVTDIVNGPMKAYPNHTVTLQNYAANSGWDHANQNGYNPRYPAAGHGVIKSLNATGQIRTILNASMSDAQVWTISIKLKVDRTVNQFLWQAYDDTSHLNRCYIGTDGKINWIYGADSRYTVPTPTTTTGSKYTLHFVKNAGVCKIFINGVEPAYDSNFAYDIGDRIVADPLYIFGSSFGQSGKSELISFGINATAFDAARCLAEHNAGDDLGGLIAQTTASGVVMQSVVDDVLEGDSITSKRFGYDQHWRAYSKYLYGVGNPFGDRIFANHAVPGDTAALVLARTDAVLALRQPTRYFLLVGINDIFGSVPWATFIANVAAIKAKLDIVNCKMHMLEILPYDGTVAATTRQWNLDLKTWCLSNNVRFHRAYDKFNSLVTDGLLNPYYVDNNGVDAYHPNTANAGCQELAARMADMGLILGQSRLGIGFPRIGL
jgi:lysophospholipase L1-like esterase